MIWRNEEGEGKGEEREREKNKQLIYLFTTGWPMTNHSMSSSSSLPSCRLTLLGLIVKHAVICYGIFLLISCSGCVPSPLFLHHRSKKACVSLLLVGEHIAVILLIISTVIWWHPSWHFLQISRTSCAGPLTSLCFISKWAFKTIWIILFSFSKTSAAVLHCFTTRFYQYIADVQELPPVSVQSGSVYSKW